MVRFPVLALAAMIISAKPSDESCPAEEDWPSDSGCSDVATSLPGGCGCGSSALSRGQPTAADNSRPSETAVLTSAQSSKLAARLIWIPAGQFVMGHNNRSISPSTFSMDGEGPARHVRVDGFWIAETEVSNVQWEEFAAATGYVTESESFGWSFVFEGQLTSEANAASSQSVHATPW